MCRELDDGVALIIAGGVLRQLNTYDFAKGLEELSYVSLGLGFQRAGKTTYVDTVVLLAFDGDSATISRQSVRNIASIVLTK